MSANFFFTEKFKNQTTPGQMPRINAGQGAREEDRIIITESGGDKNDDIILHIGIPGVTALFLITLALLLCVRSRRRQVENRNQQPVDVEEGESDGGNWQGRGFDSETPDRQISNNGIQNAAYLNESPERCQSEKSNAQSRVREQPESYQTPGPSISSWQKLQAKEKAAEFARKYNLQVSPSSSFDSETNSERTRHMPTRTGLESDLRVGTLKKQLQKSSEKYEIQRSTSKDSDTARDCSELERMQDPLQKGTNDKDDTLRQPRRLPYASKYQILEQDYKGFRYKTMTVEEQQEWARENYLTIVQKQRKHGRRKTFDIGVDSNSKTMDMSNNKVRRNHSVLTRQSSLSPSPYKLQVQNSKRPNKKDLYFQGFKASRTRKMFEVAKKKKSAPVVNDSCDSPSYYQHFETPSPPSMIFRPDPPRSAKTQNDIPESSRQLAAGSEAGTLTTVSSIMSEDTYEDKTDTEEIQVTNDL